MYEMTDLQFQCVYNVLSFCLASMSATTVYLWFHVPSVHDRYQSAVAISGLVTFIAAYHYVRIFNSWVDAYDYTHGKGAPQVTGVPFNDAYRYMDWLLTVPLLLIEILLVMKLTPGQFTCRSWTLGLGSALMILSGYHGEQFVSGDLTPRWQCFKISMGFFLYIVFELAIGLASATNSESDRKVRGKIRLAQWATIFSWTTYPVVYLIPMYGEKYGVTAANAVVGIQVGYCVSDIISKCGVGLLIYQISAAKSAQELK
jgi:bacteriorhodopsin